MTTMRAKFVVSNVERFETGERVTFRAVCKPEGYGDDGLDEDNTFSKFTPTADLSMYIANPSLLGQFEIGQTYYADFSPTAKHNISNSPRHRSAETGEFVTQEFAEANPATTIKES